MHDRDQSLTEPLSAIRSDAVVPSSPDDRLFMTPREVERRHPRLSRRSLAQRRSAGLPPRHKIVLGCIMYDAAEIERFFAPPAIVRCAIYARTDSLSDPSRAVVREVEACDDYVGRAGWTPIYSCAEFGPPSRPKALRPGFQEILSKAFRGAFDVLLVHDLSHIATNVIDQRRFIRRFKKLNVQVCEVVALTRAD